MVSVLKPGMRVLVPFGKNNKKTVGFVLSLTKACEYDSPKYITEMLDDEPVLSDNMLKLAVWVRSMCFATFFDVAKVMLPTGLWYGKTEICELVYGISDDEAYIACKKNESAEKLINLLIANNRRMSVKDIDAVLGEDERSKAVKRLTKDGIIKCDILLKQTKRDKTVKIAYSITGMEELITSSGRRTVMSASRRAVLDLLSNVGECSVHEISYFTGVSTHTIENMAKAGLIGLKNREVLRMPRHDEIRFKILPPRLYRM